VSEISLGDYTGYIFIEMVRAREIADRYSRELAGQYAADPVLKHFSVPRFKVPKMNLTIPILISGARFRQIIAFKMGNAEFTAFIRGRVGYVRRTVSKDHLLILGRGTLDDNVPREAQAFYEALVANDDPARPETLVGATWQKLFENALAAVNLLDTYREQDRDGQLLRETTAEIVEVVKGHTVIESTTIENLLINPETNVVKNESSDTSVFVVGAEIIEEGFFLRTIKDDDTGVTHPIVEFE
jgi:hypothetical protein